MRSHVGVTGAESFVTRQRHPNTKSENLGAINPSTFEDMNG